MNAKPIPPADTSSGDSREPPSPAAALDPGATADHPHNFDVQKELHRQIRNDPDYDDWEYGTEPLPHESWRPPEPPAGESKG